MNNEDWRSGRWSHRLALIVMLIVCPAPQGSHALAAGEDVVAEAPSFKVGDEWHWVGGAYPTYVRVIALQGEGSVVESNLDLWCREGCRYVRDKNGIAVSGTNKKGEPAYVTGLRTLDFPLKIGKEWTQDIDLRLVSDGTIRPFSNRWKIEAFEEVVVKAGTFKAFRMSWYQENRGSYRWNGNATLWWSPEIKAFVKRVVHTTGWGSDWELASFVLK